MSSQSTLVSVEAVIPISDLDYTIFKQFKPCRNPRGNPHRTKNKIYLNCICTFDIETTRLKDIEQSVMYIWQFNIHDQVTVVGRYWSEFFDMLKKIKRLLGNYWLVIYVHNLSYEFQFLKGWYDFQNDEVFRTEPRKVLKCEMFDTFEFRCSYFLTNLSLDAFTRQMGIENKKLSGDIFDYSKIRYPWTPLSDYELQYCINDVKGLAQALIKKLKADGDTVRTVPLTSTAYVRRDVKRSMKNFNHKELQQILPDVELYSMLREAFRGGNTHANRWYSGDIIENVSSIDIVSSYPAVMLTCQYPMTKFINEPDCSIRQLKKLLKNKAVLMRVAFYDLDLTDNFNGCPYISRDKCRNIQKGVFDNGRVLRAEYLETTITDIDFKIIKNQYKWTSLNPFKVMYASYDWLPSQIRSQVMKYYTVKTELKGIKEDDPQYIYYCNNKAKLNSCYGMTAQDPVKDTLEYVNGDFTYMEKPVADILKASNKKAFLRYQWGVWVTRHARARLQEGIDLAGHNFIYADTDSVKYIGDLDITDFNNKRILEAIKRGAYAKDNKGVLHYIGVYENEGYSLPNRFSTLGAKKYVLEDSDKKLHITIAGVNKKKGAKELQKIENFKEGFIFKDAGGTESIFNDNIDMTVNIEGHDLIIRDNIVIRDSTYTLGLTAEYLDILKGCIEIKYSDYNILGYYKLKKEFTDTAVTI